MNWLAVPHELAGFLSACLTRTIHNFLAQRWWSWIWSLLVRKGMLQKGRTKVEWARRRHILYGFNTGPYNSDLTPLAQCASFATVYMLFLVFLAMNLKIILGHFLFWSVFGFPLTLCTRSIASLLIVVSIFLRTCSTLSWTSALVSLSGIGSLYHHVFPSFVFGHTVLVHSVENPVWHFFLRDPCFFSWVEHFLIWGVPYCFW